MSGLTPASFRGASIALMVITTVIAVARTTLTARKGVGVHWDDAWLSIGYILFMAVSGVYVGRTDLFFRIDDVFEGRSGPYAGLGSDIFSMKRMFFLTSPGLWVTLCVWQAYSVDVITDFTIMLLPIGLIRNLQMPIGRKLSLGVLFCLGISCIIAATLRVVRLGKVADTGPSPAWLALWSTIESSIGCGPGLYRKAKSIRMSQNRYKYETEGSSEAKMGSSSERSKLRGPATIGIPLATHLVTSTRATRNVDAGDSEEDLVSRKPGDSITVTKSVMVD
ncbi:hypothetical protein PG993_008434 [Apiospora rasikravindrae]|uniref:Rhodopsin domain-containing protein n=1 Tax=Apiospora rasikravindrae TaxID=990691 RepID=A0ABR1T2P6_9PEZI